MIYNCFNLLDMRNLQEQVKKAFFYQKWFLPFTVLNSDLKNFTNSQPPASNFKSFSWSLELFFSQKVRTILVTKYQKKFICQKVSSKEKFWFDLDSNLVEIHVINIQKTLKKAVRALKVKELWIWKHAMVVEFCLICKNRAPNS